MPETAAKHSVALERGVCSSDVLMAEVPVCRRWRSGEGIHHVGIELKWVARGWIESANRNPIVVCDHNDFLAALCNALKEGDLGISASQGSIEIEFQSGRKVCRI